MPDINQIPPPWGGHRFSEREPSELGIGARCLGALSWDIESCGDEIGYLDQLKSHGGYDRFAGRNGAWQAIMLRNRDGDASDERSHEFKGAAKPTEHWERIPGLAGLLEAHFNLDLASNVRVMQAVAGGMILPHKDYREHRQGGFNRLHVPIRTSPLAVSAEADVVFHQRRLEAWLIEGREVHSALNASSTVRHHLTIDFPVAIPLAEVFRKPLAPVARVCVLEREPLPPGWPDFVRVTGAAMRSDTVEQAATMFTRMAYIYAVHMASVYDWLVEAARHSPDPECLNAAEALRTYMFFARQD